jgi:hypothetical protein
MRCVPHVLAMIHFLHSEYLNGAILISVSNSAVDAVGLDAAVARRRLGIGHKLLLHAGDKVDV